MELPGLDLLDAEKVEQSVHYAVETNANEFCLDGIVRGSKVGGSDG